MELTPEQQQLILDAWNKNPTNPPSLLDLIKLVFVTEIELEIQKPEAERKVIDGRSEHGKTVKMFLASKNLRARASSDDVKKTDSIILTDEQKLYIVNNIGTNTPLEISKTIFNNNALSNLNAETRAVTEFVKSLDTKVIYGGKEVLNEVPSGAYEPPKTLDKALKKINEYVNFVNGVGALNAQQKKCVEKLIEYLHTYSFIRLMNTYDSHYDRKTCEDAFIRYTYDKPDLTQEEIDQYVELSNHIVQGYKIQRRSESLQKKMESITNNNEEGMKMSMSFVEAIGKASTEYHQCLDRRKKLLESLTQKRSARLDAQIKDSASILNLVQMWRNYEERQELLKIAQLEQEKIATEVDRLSTVSEIKARLMGFTKEQALYG